MRRLPRYKLTPLPVTIALAIGDEAERLGLEAPAPNVDGITTELDPGNLGLWLNAGVIDPDRPWPVVAAVIAHEVVHSIDYAFEHVGEESRTDEIRAYYTEHVVLWAATEVERRRNQAHPKTHNGTRSTITGADALPA